MSERYYIETSRDGWDITDGGKPLRDTGLLDRLNEQDDDLDRARTQIAALERERDHWRQQAGMAGANSGALYAALELALQLCCVPEHAQDEQWYANFELASIGLKPAFIDGVPS